MKQLRQCFTGIIVVCAAISSHVVAASESGNVCQVRADKDVFIIERSAHGAERLTISSATYVLRYDGRVYLSTMRRSKIHVIDLSSHADRISNDKSSLTSSTAISSIRDYIQLVNQAYPTNKITINYGSLSPETCTIERIAPERFTLRSLPVNALAPRL
jgi:hypothetical protein